jgi:hypothetical protein
MCLQIHLDKIIILNLIIAGFLYACGGSGGSGGAEPDDLQPPYVNGDLSGRLFMGADGKVLDLSTGEYSAIPGVDWGNETNNNSYLTNVEFTSTSSYDGSEFLLTVNKCAEASDQSYSLLHDDCLELYSNGSRGGIRGRKISYIKPGAKLSRDSNYIAFFHNDDRVALAKDELFIYDRNFELISRSKELPDTYGRSLDWTNDGRIVFSNDQTLYITSQYETSYSEILSFNNNDNAIYPYPNEIAVSPDGSKIAFSLVTSSTVVSFSSMGDIWVVNIDGSDLHKLAVRADGTSPYMGYPTWSPDGSYIMMIDGYTGSAPVRGTTGTIYAVPSDSREVILNNDGSNGVIALKSYFYGNDNSLTFDAMSDGNWAWLP